MINAIFGCMNNNTTHLYQFINTASKFDLGRFEGRDVLDACRTYVYHQHGVRGAYQLRDEANELLHCSHIGLIEIVDLGEML